MRVTIPSSTKGADVSFEDEIDPDNEDLVAIRVGRKMEIVSKAELVKALRALGFEVHRGFI